MLVALSGLRETWRNCHDIITPVRAITNATDPDKQEQQEILDSLYLVKANKQYVNDRLIRSVQMASKATNIRKELIVALLKTESEFNPRAISPKGYKGLMQTPSATFSYPEVDVMHGACILKDKLHDSKGDLMSAMILYKGGGSNPSLPRYHVAKKQATETLNLYNYIKSNTKGG
jgi:soluble lytic murein transglycosylase-like protein